MSRATSCPECGSRKGRVVVTRDTKDGGHTLRRRLCLACDHRWYTLQPNERPIADSDFTWVGKNSGTHVLLKKVPADQSSRGADLTAGGRSGYAMTQKRSTAP